MKFKVYPVAVLTLVAVCLGPQLAFAAAPYHHVHLTATDPAEASKWYGDMFGGTAARLGMFQTTQFESVLFIYLKRAKGFGGSDGSSVDHIGFSFTDLEDKMAQWKSDGVKIVQELRPIPGTPIKYGFIEDPYGTKIEVLSDPDLLGFHHVHLHTPDVDGTIKWYMDAFGGEKKNYANLPFLPSLRYENMWLIVQHVPEAKAGTRGRSVDHISWSFPDLFATAEKMKAAGIEFKMGPVKTPGATIAFIEGPDGVSIELVEQAE